MNEDIKKHFYSKLSDERIKINWNKNPIKMDLFLSFLTVEVTKRSDHLGASNGWVLYENEELKLRISGGIVGKVEYLDSIRYGCNFANVYNNFVNPFYIFDILNQEGKIFFINYYKDDIEKLRLDQIKKVAEIQDSLSIQRRIFEAMIDEIKTLSDISEARQDAEQ